MWLIYSMHLGQSLSHPDMAVAGGSSAHKSWCSLGRNMDSFPSLLFRRLCRELELQMNLLLCDAAGLGRLDTIVMATWTPEQQAALRSLVQWLLRQFIKHP